MLSRPTIADHLRLTPEQRQALARVIAERNAARAQGRSGPANESAFNQKAQSVLSKTPARALGQPARNAGPVRRDDRTARKRD